MNLKVSHLVSVQFGIFVGIVCALAYLRFEYARPRNAVKMRPPGTERTSPVGTTSRSGDQNEDIADNGDEPESIEEVAEQRPPALPNEYSPEAVERYRAEATRLYYQQIAPRRPVSASSANGSVAAVAPAYSEVAEQPAPVQTYAPAPETVAYVQPSEVIVYPQQFVAFSHPRRFANRCRPAPQPGALASNPHRRQGRGGNHLNGSPADCSPLPSAGLRPPGGVPGVLPRQNTNVSSSSSAQAFTSGRKR
jgi:hypothetical protein